MAFEKMSVAQLRAHIKRAQRALDRKVAKERAVVRKEIQQRLAALGMGIEDLAAPKRGRRRRTLKKRASRSSKAKYRNPENRKETWSGRGRAPAWAQPYRDKRKLDELLIK